MREKRVAITGIGVISSNATGKAAFWEAILKGSSGIAPISLFDASIYKVKTAGEVKDFQPQNILGEKGLRVLDRSTKLVSCAVKLALEDAKLEINEDNTQETGLVIGTTLGSLRSVSEFDKEALKEGPRFVNPALFPNTVINSPAAQAAIRFNIKGLNATISTGFSCGLDAIDYAVDSIRFGRVKTVLAGAVEELCEQTFLGFYKTGFLAGLNDGGLELSCPFDKRRNGIILGEGSVVLVLEDLESAVARQAYIYAEIKGFGMGFALGLVRSIESALKKSAVAREGIDYVSSAANSTVTADLLETNAIKEVFANAKEKLYISSIKSMIGECFSAGAAFQVVAALCAIEKQMLPPTINYKEKDPDCDLNYVVNAAHACKVNNVLINAFGPSGCNSSLVISKFAG